MTDDRFRGGVNCCFKNSSHLLLNLIPRIRDSSAFADFLTEDRTQRLSQLNQQQEDAGSYLLNLIEKQKWLGRLWKKECGIRFIEYREELKSGKKSRKKLPGRDPVITCTPVSSQEISRNLTDSLSIVTDDLVILKRLEHPPPRYLLLNLTCKAQTPIPLKYFESLEMFDHIQYKAVGYVLHFGHQFSNFGHYVFADAEFRVHDDLSTTIQQIPPELSFNEICSPTLVLYRRVTKRRMRNPAVKRYERLVPNQE